MTLSRVIVKNLFLVSLLALSQVQATVPELNEKDQMKHLTYNFLRNYTSDINGFSWEPIESGFTISTQANTIKFNDKNIVTQGQLVFKEIFENYFVKNPTDVLRLREIVQQHKDEKTRIDKDTNMSSNDKNSQRKNIDEGKKNQIQSIVDDYVQRCSLNQHQQNLQLLNESFETNLLNGNSFQGIDEALINLTKLFIMDQLETQEGVWGKVSSAITQRYADDKKQRLDQYRDQTGATQENRNNNSKQRAIIENEFKLTLALQAQLQTIVQKAYQLFIQEYPNLPTFIKQINSIYTTKVHFGISLFLIQKYLGTEQRIINEDLAEKLIDSLFGFSIYLIKNFNIRITKQEVESFADFKMQTISKLLFACQSAIEYERIMFEKQTEKEVQKVFDSQKLVPLLKKLNTEIISKSQNPSGIVSKALDILKIIISEDRFLVSIFTASFNLNLMNQVYKSTKYFGLSSEAYKKYFVRGFYMMTNNVASFQELSVKICDPSHIGTYNYCLVTLNILGGLHSNEADVSNGIQSLNNTSLNRGYSVTLSQMHFNFINKLYLDVEPALNNYTKVTIQSRVLEIPKQFAMELLNYNLASIKFKEYMVKIFTEILKKIQSSAATSVESTVAIESFHEFVKTGYVDKNKTQKGDIFQVFQEIAKQNLTNKKLSLFKNQFRLQDIELSLLQTYEQQDESLISFNCQNYFAFAKKQITESKQEQDLNTLIAQAYALNVCNDSLAEKIQDLNNEISRIAVEEYNWLNAGQLQILAEQVIIAESKITMYNGYKNIIDTQEAQIQDY